MPPGKKIAIIGAPLDLGAGRRGVDMGPSALRVANLNARLEALGFEVDDLGNVHVVQQESSRPGAASARYLNPIAETCKDLAEKVERAAGQGKFPLVLGGDHSVAVGTVSGMAEHFRKKKRTIGLIWMDAHADMNTPETSPSGNVHGMPLACLCGTGPRALTHLYGYAPKVNPANVVLVGIRDVDSMERVVREGIGRHCVHHARHRRAWYARGDAGGDQYRVARDGWDSPLARYGRGGPEGSARRRHAGARRLHLPRGASGDGDVCRFAADDLHGSCGGESGLRRGEPDSAVGC